MIYPNHRIIFQGMLLLFCLFVSKVIAQEVPQPAPQIVTGAWAEALKEHPRLLGSRAHLRALAKAKPELYNQVVKGLAGQWQQADGIIHAVEGLPPEKIAPYIQRALKHVERGATNIHQDSWIWMEEVAFTYDFFYDAIAPADRQKMIDWLNANRISFTTDENAFHNSTLSKILTYVRIAYATWGENPEAKAFRDHALVKLYEGKVLPVLQEVGAGGGFTEAGWYARGSLWHLTQALELARRFENYDGFAKAPRFFYQRLAYEMFQPYPGRWEYGTERFPVEGDGSHIYGGHTEYPRLMRTVLAQYFRGSELSRAIANKHRRGSNSQSRIEDFLYEETGEAPLDLAAFPLAHHAAGIGKVYARSDWTDAATWFRFDCGDYWVGHQHFEVGNFEIFQYEPLATESGEYHDWASDHAMNWLVRTIAHNSILVHDPNEKWTMMRDGGRLKYANDGGQAKKWEWTVDTLDQWKQKRQNFERGDIVAYQNTPSYLYVAGDCTAAYAPSKLQSWVRQIVYLRPGTFVIFDRVISTKPEFEKTWLLHSHNEPSLQNQNATITNGKGKLTVQTLLPEKAQIRKFHGYTYRGQTFDPPQTALSKDAAKWRLEVLPATAQNEDVFLHVLSTGEPVPAQLIGNGNQIGVLIGNAEVLFNGKVGGTLKLKGQQVSLQQKIEVGKYE